MRDRLVRGEAVEFGSQILDAQKPVFLHFSFRNLSSGFDSFLGLPDSGFGKRVPFANKCSIWFEALRGFSNLAACNWLDRRTLFASAQSFCVEFLL